MPERNSKEEVPEGQRGREVSSTVDIKANRKAYLAKCENCTLADAPMVPTDSPRTPKLAIVEGFETFTVTPKDIERFHSYVKEWGIHWIWTGGVTKRQGYGKFWINDRTVPAHRFAWFIYRGPLNLKLELDHLCRITHCVHPCCLEEVTRQVNLLRGTSPVALNAKKLACLNNHPFEGDNLSVLDNGERRCLTCARERQAAYRARKKARLGKV